MGVAGREANSYAVVIIALSFSTAERTMVYLVRGRSGLGFDGMTWSSHKS